MSLRGFSEFCLFLQTETGITLEQSKHYLVSSRLNKLMAEQQIDSLIALLDRMKSPRMSDLKQAVIEVMTTNETQWFRDYHPLKAFADVIIPSLVKSGHQSIRIWSAACSSGQEAYSTSMVIEEHRDMYRHLHLHNPSVQIVATDLSHQILQKARAGVYDNTEILRGLDEQRKKNFFTFNDGSWELSQKIKNRVQFRQHNLLNGFSNLGQFDVIFCRNVLIYFSAEIKSDILNRMAKQLKPDGYLILGSSETPSNYTDQFKMEKINGTVVYRPALFS